MRFLLYDRVTRLVPERVIEGVKTFSLAEAFVQGHFHRQPLVPGALLIEAMAQLLGWLVIASRDFQQLAMLSIVEGARVDPGLRPGFRGEIEAELVSLSSTDALGKARMRAGGVTVASAERVIYTLTGGLERRILVDTFCYCSGWALADGDRPRGRSG